MYQSNKSYINSELKISDAVKQNPALLVVIEHFGINESFQNKNIAEFCNQAGIRTEIFISVCNLYNGFNLEQDCKCEISDIPTIIAYLKNSHIYYKTEKYPEIIDSIKNLTQTSNCKEIVLIENFFNEYFKEVSEHVAYEEEIVFPYFLKLYDNPDFTDVKKSFANQYKNHHSDIESKLSDLKNLLLQHLKIKLQGPIQRKLLFGLFELEYDLKIHSLIEEKILVPLVLSIENKKTNV